MFHYQVWIWLESTLFTDVYSNVPRRKWWYTFHSDTCSAELGACRRCNRSRVLVDIVIAMLFQYPSAAERGVTWGVSATLELTARHVGWQLVFLFRLLNLFGCWRHTPFITGAEAVCTFDDCNKSSIHSVIRITQGQHINDNNAIIGGRRACLVLKL